jgi:hypothetical protein
MPGIRATPSLAQISAAIQEARHYYVSSFGCSPSAGFGAAYLGLITQLLGCIDCGVGFRLVKITYPTGFSTQFGYADYFIPFCDEVSGPLLQFLNRGQLPYSRKLPIISEVAALWLRTSVRPSGSYSFSFENTARQDCAGSSLDFDASWGDKRQMIMHALWQYNDQTAEEVGMIKSRVSLPPQYIAMVIRRGDKLTEFPYVQIERYRDAIESIDPGHAALFVASDDYAVVRKVQEVFFRFRCVYSHRDD